MKTNYSQTIGAGALPAELQLIPARIIRQYIPETNLWRLEQSGELPAVRVGRRRFYRMSDWAQFLKRCAQREPLQVPWGKSKTTNLVNMTTIGSIKTIVTETAGSRNQVHQQEGV